ncbi:MAG TPA: glutaredoxin 3 [Gammaproteobacteria bacterium]|jgi:glutaredoxin 3
MSRVEIYTKRWCAFCQMAKSLLGRMGLAFEEYDVTSDPRREQEMKERSGRHTVPQVFIDGRPVGGYAELSELHATGRLADPPAGGGAGEQG